MDKKAKKRRSDDGINAKNSKGSENEKFIKLIGGKKAKNAEATAKWIEKTCTKEQEGKMNADLEKQFNESLQNKLTGNTRMHAGIGFHGSEAEKPRQNKIIKFADSDDEDVKKEEKSSKKEESKPKIQENESKPEPKPAAKVIKTKKDFYSQFTKAS